MLEPITKAIARRLYKASLVGKVLDNKSDPLAKRIHPYSQSKLSSSCESNFFVQGSDELLKNISKRNQLSKSPKGGDKSEILSSCTFTESTSIEQVLLSLRTYGVAIFPSLYSADKLLDIKQEFNNLISSGYKFSDYVHDEDENAGNSYALDFKRSKLRRQKFPEIFKLFSSPTLFDISKAFFAGEDFEFNTNMFVQWTEHTAVPMSGELHWDKQLTLKSWLYVSEGTDGYGAMRADVGSSSWTRYVREDAMFDGIKYKNINNKVGKDSPNTISTGGPAGTFFIFVSDTGHGASKVEKGKRREIIRSEARPVRVKEWAAWANK